MKHKNDEIKNKAQSKGKPKIPEIIARVQNGILPFYFSKTIYFLFSLKSNTILERGSIISKLLYVSFKVPICLECIEYL